MMSSNPQNNNYNNGNNNNNSNNGNSNNSSSSSQTPARPSPYSTNWPESSHTNTPRSSTGTATLAPTPTSAHPNRAMRASVTTTLPPAPTATARPGWAGVAETVTVRMPGAVAPRVQAPPTPATLVRVWAEDAPAAAPAVASRTTFCEEESSASESSE